MTDERARRTMFARAGLAAPIPTIDQRRRWEWIDDRVPPAGDPDGRFATFQQWVNKAASWIGWSGSKCFDALDRPCRIGRDFMRARDEDAFPVRWYGPDRFPEPIVPTKRALLARTAVLATGDAGIDHAGLRAVKGLGNLGPAAARGLLSGYATHADGRWTITAEGRSVATLERDRALRAACLS